MGVGPVQGSFADTDGIRSATWTTSTGSAARNWHGRVFFISDQVSPTDVSEAPEGAVRPKFGQPVERIGVGRFVVNVCDLPPHAPLPPAPQGHRESMGPFGAG